MVCAKRRHPRRGRCLISNFRLFLESLPKSMSDRVQNHPLDTQPASIDDPSSPASVLKHGNLYGIFDGLGNIDHAAAADRGLYHSCTRLLSTYRLSMRGGKSLVGLSSAAGKENFILYSDCTNPFLIEDDLNSGAFYFHRELLLFQNCLLEKVVYRNESHETRTLHLELRWGSDFSDLFEVRGQKRKARGEATWSSDFQTLSYTGLDGVVRESSLRVRGPGVTQYGEGKIEYTVELAPKSEQVLVIEALFTVDGEGPPVTDYETARRGKLSWREGLDLASCQIISGLDNSFQKWISRAWADLTLLITETEDGYFPYAGVPWFCAAFGRDALVTALQTLWISPQIAKGVLCYLARYQATTTDLAREAEPGKILHEKREGEMVALGESPYGLYYGTADATPLFIWLLGAYLERTGDLALVEELRGAYDAALQWMDRKLEESSSGFLQYDSENHSALLHQGWKDADDAVLDRHGDDVASPYALAEIQGYVYAALRSAAKIEAAQGAFQKATWCEERAAHFRKHFNATYWDPDLGAAGSLGLAVAGKNRLVRVVSSNAGQCLATGIVDEEKAPLLCRTMINTASFSGWGMRTLSSQERAYSPLSYHNGAVWPHDTSLILWGLSQQRQGQAVRKVFDGMLDVARHFEYRLPELFSGFPRRPDRPPIRYPNACSPQAWAAGACFLAVQASLGLRVYGAERRIVFSQPTLPASVPFLHLKGLQVGDVQADVLIRRQGDTVSISLIKQTGPVSIELNQDGQ